MREETRRCLQSLETERQVQKGTVALEVACCHFAILNSYLPVESLTEDKVLTEKRKLLIRSLDEGTINGLLGELFETRVLNPEEIEIVKCKNATVMDKARALLDSVILKGAPACQICVTYICEEDSHLAGTLRLSAAPQAVPVWGNPAMPTSSGSGRSVKLCSLDEAKRIWKEKSTEIYPIMDKSSRTRLALIICNEEFDSLSKRTGAEVDIIGITMLLQNLGYKVDVKRNLTALIMFVGDIPQKAVFIMKLVEHLQEYAHSCDVEEIFHRFDFHLSTQMIKHRCPALKGLLRQDVSTSSQDIKIRKLYEYLWAVMCIWSGVWEG
ncbi:PREDICTED: caspase-1-like [Mandrillus leucophaeus]|uniref:caspase-1-like n=1 Tax=Mandrillus leucophaeus TaxID=9568 RepID=UPI0005F5772E|nr:PREDICTED: caspase-1-like [Mandrillus leucophaeus]